MTMRVPIILAVLGALVVLTVLLGALRLLLLTRPRRGGFDCSLWREPRGTWRHGLMRFGRDSLHWYGVIGMMPRPQLSLRRVEVVDVVRRALPDGGPAAGRGPSEVTYTLVKFVRRDRGPIRVIVPTPSASAIVTWLEAAPTGSLQHGTY